MAVGVGVAVLPGNAVAVGVGVGVSWEATPGLPGLGFAWGVQSAAASVSIYDGDARQRTTGRHTRARRRERGGILAVAHGVDDRAVRGQQAHDVARIAQPVADGSLQAEQFTGKVEVIRPKPRGVAATTRYSPGSRLVAGSGSCPALSLTAQPASEIANSPGLKISIHSYALSLPPCGASYSTSLSRSRGQWEGVRVEMGPAVGVTVGGKRCSPKLGPKANKPSATVTVRRSGVVLV